MFGVTSVAQDQCYLVHQAADQCAFVKTYCSDDNSSIIPYLELYFCALPNAKPLAFLILALWMVMLFSTIGVTASDFFTPNLNTISGVLGLSESLAGVTLLAFGNGSPDVFSTFVAMRTNNGGLAIGELIGAAGFISGIVAGSMALIRPFKVARFSFIRDLGFFIVAVFLTLFFLIDGVLQIWECSVMIGFYLFYVIFIFTTHWIQNRRERRKESERYSRDHFSAEVSRYLDDEPNIRNSSGSRARTGDGSTNDPSSHDLNGPPTLIDLEANDGEDSERRATRPSSDTERRRSDFGPNSRDEGLAAEITGTRSPRPGSHKSAESRMLIRPSLLGALEFRAVMSSLERARNTGEFPLSYRRGSEEDRPVGLQRRRTFSPTRSNPSFYRSAGHFFGAMDEENRDPNQSESQLTRGRAVSATPAPIPRGRQFFGSPSASGHLAVPSQNRGTSSLEDITSVVSKTGDSTPSRGAQPEIPDHRADTDSQSEIPSIIETAHGDDQHLDPTGAVSTSARKQDHLARKNSAVRSNLSISISRRTTDDVQSPSFTPYRDDPDAPMTSPLSPRIGVSVSAENLLLHSQKHAPGSKVPRWWPIRFLPAPRVLASTLFPTLSAWSEKSFLGKFLALVAVPSVFLLTLTIPVVEIEQDEHTAEPKLHSTSLTASRSQSRAPENTQASGEQSSEAVPPPVYTDARPGMDSRNASGLANHSETGKAHSNKSHDRQNSTAALEVPTERHGDYPRSAERVAELDEEYSPAHLRNWNRWLLCVQLITAPLFVACIAWVNADGESVRQLVLYLIYTLIGSLVVLIAVLVITRADRPPKYRAAFCALGFVASIAWISTIAGEVVGVLKTFGVISGIGDAILGLTVFAVGNSLGDLVANSTVAKLGYPVMALSACFGGPMLNILIGIGVSGLYVTAREASQNQNPIYELQVGLTLLISGVSLLITLLGLLCVIPLNKWSMDRRVGWALVGIWLTTTVVNVIVEVTGNDRALYL